MHRESATKALFRGGKLHIMIVQKIERNAERILFTPGYISVSAKHVFSVSDDGNRVPFPITPAVKGSASPAMSTWRRGNTAPTEGCFQQQESGTH